MFIKHSKIEFSILDPKQTTIPRDRKVSEDLGPSVQDVTGTSPAPGILPYRCCSVLDSGIVLPSPPLPPNLCPPGTLECNAMLFENKLFADIFS